MTAPITRADIQELLDNQTEEVNRHVSIVAEHFQGQVQLVAEQVMAVKEVVDSHSTTLAGHTEMLGQLMEDMQDVKTELKQKVDRNEFTRLEKRVVVLERRMA